MSPKKLSNVLLMGPGPSNRHETVQQVSAVDLSHTHQVFRDIYNQSRQDARNVFGTSHVDTYPWDLSATSTLSGAFNNLAPKKVLVADAGAFSKRLAMYAAQEGADVRLVSVEPGSIVAPEAIEAELQEMSDCDVVAVVHGLTDTGLYQPSMGDIADIAHKHGALVLADLVTTAGGMPPDPAIAKASDLATAGIDKADIKVTSGQKCVSGPAGTSVVSYGPEALRRIETSGRAPDFATSILAFRDMIEKRVFHHTLSPPAMLGLAQALARVKEEGLDRRYDRHEYNATALRTGLKALGLTYFGDERFHMPMVHAVLVPDGMTDTNVYAGLLEHNIEIGLGLGPLKGKILRIGLMGENARPDAVLRLLRALGTVLNSLGHSCDIEAGYREADGYYRSLPNPQLLEPLP